LEGWREGLEARMDERDQFPVSSTHQEREADCLEKIEDALDADCE
jgi:hypothetical protein